MAALNLLAKLGFDGRGFHTGMDGAKKKGGQVASYFGGPVKSMIAGAFTAGAVVAFSKSVIDLGGELQDTAGRLGISTDAVQEFKYAAEQSSSDLDAMANGLEKVAKAQEEVSQDSKRGQELADTFDRMGVSVDQLLSKTPEEVVRQLGENLGGLQVNAQLTADMLDIFGKSGGKLIPVLQSLKEKSAELRDSGMFMSKEEIEMLDEAGDKMDKLGTKFKVMASSVVIAVTSPMESMTRFFQAFATDQFEAEIRGAISQKTLDQLNADRDANRPEEGPALASAEDFADAERTRHQQEMDEVVKINEEIERLTKQRKEKEMTDEQKMQAFIKKRLEIFEKFNSLQFAPGTLGRAQLDKELAEADLGIAELKDKKGARTSSADSLAQIGGRVGGTDHGIGEMRRTNTLLARLQSDVGELTGFMRSQQ